MDASAVKGPRPTAVPADLFDQEITAGVIDENGHRLSGEGFFVGVLGTGVYVVLTESKIRLEAECVVLATELSSEPNNAQMTWASGNAFVVSMIDAFAQSANGTVAFAVEDA